MCHQSFNNQNHPELGADEIFYSNFGLFNHCGKYITALSRFNELNFITKRKGQKCFDCNDRQWGQHELPNQCFPVFIKRWEFDLFVQDPILHEKLFKAYQKFVQPSSTFPDILEKYLNEYLNKQPTNSDILEKYLNKQPTNTFPIQKYHLGQYVDLTATLNQGRCRYLPGFRARIEDINYQLSFATLKMHDGTKIDGVGFYCFTPA